MTLKYAVSFEFEMRPPVTHRGEVTASSPSAAARRAVLAAQTALRPVNWSSFLFVALERVDRRDGDDAEAIVDERSDTHAPAEPA